MTLFFSYFFIFFSSRMVIQIVLLLFTCFLGLYYSTKPRAMPEKKLFLNNSKKSKYIGVFVESGQNSGKIIKNVKKKNTS